jgi:hypothetical protein
MRSTSRTRVERRLPPLAALRLATTLRKLRAVRGVGVWLEAPRSEARHGYPYPQEQASGPVAGGKSQPAGPSSSSDGPYPRSALLALVSSIVEAGPGYRHIPIHHPLRLVVEPSFRTHTPQTGKDGLQSARRLSDPFPQIDRTPPGFLRTGVALSFLARRS